MLFNQLSTNLRDISNKSQRVAFVEAAILALISLRFLRGVTRSRLWTDEKLEEFFIS